MKGSLSLPDNRRPSRTAVTGYYLTRTRRALWTESPLEWETALLLDFDPNIHLSATVRNRIEFELTAEVPKTYQAVVEREAWLVLNWDKYEVRFRSENEECSRVGVVFGFITDDSTAPFSDRVDVLQEVCYLARTPVDVDTKSSLIRMLLNTSDSKIDSIARSWRTETPYGSKVRIVSRLLVDGTLFLTSTPNAKLEESSVSFSKPKDSALPAYFTPYPRMCSRMTHHPYYHLSESTAARVTRDSVEIDGRNYEVIDGQDYEAATLKNSETGEVYRNISLSALENRTPPRPEEPDKSCSDETWFLWLKMEHPDLFDAYLRRKKAVEDFLLYSKRTAQDYQRAADHAGLSARTLRRLVRKMESGAGDRALVPRNFKRGPKGVKRIDPLVAALAKEIIENEYLKKQRLSKYSTFLLVNSACELHGYKPPSYMYVCRQIAAIDPRRVTLDRYGQRNYYEKWGMRGGRYEDKNFPLQTVEIDHTQLDVYVFYPGMDEPIRPWLSLAIDVYSRTVWAYFLGVSPPNDDTFAMLIRMGVLPKTNKLGIELAHDWPVHGLPAFIYTDNGKDFRARLVDIGCESQGIYVRRGPVRVPNFRAYIERIFGTINTEFVQHLPGRVFPISNENRKLEYDPKKEARLTLHQLEELFVRWIVDGYHITPHKELGGATPLEKWNALTGRDSPFAPQLPEDIERFKDDFLSFPKDQDGTRVLSHAGTIELYNELYVPDVDDLPRDTPLPIRLDPTDMSQIRILHPLTHKYVSAHRQDGPGRITLEEIEYLNRTLDEKMRKVIEVRARCLLDLRTRTNQFIFQNEEERRRMRSSARRAEVIARDSPDPLQPEVTQQEIAEHFLSKERLEEMRQSLTPEEESRDD